MPQRDSFAVVVRGQALGFETESLERTATGWLYVDQTTLPNVNQRTEVRATPSGAVEHMHQRHQQGSVVAVSDLTYEGGRIRGTIQLPTQKGEVQTLAIDTVAVPGVVDDNFVAAIEPGLPWAPNAEITVPVFVGGQNITQQWTFHVVGTERVTVPAGTFDAYKAELRLGARTLVTYVEVAVPHRVLKRVPLGSPLEFVRIR